MGGIIVTNQDGIKVKLQIDEDTFKTTVKRMNQEFIDRFIHLLDERLTQNAYQIIQGRFRERFENYCIETNNEDYHHHVENFNIDYINHMWKSNDCYIPRRFNLILQKDKYLAARRDLLTGSRRLFDTDPIIIIIDERNGACGFQNGRNRFSNLRDMGFTECYACVKYI